MGEVQRQAGFEMGWGEKGALQGGGVGGPRAESVRTPKT